MATPRLPGSKAVADVENAIVEQLSAFGFAVQQEVFRTSPRRLYAASVMGAGVGWVALALVPLFVFPVTGWIAATIGVASFTTVCLVAAGIANGALPLDVEHVEARNIVASRSPQPALWLVAHSDSKNQSISLKTRIIASVVTAVSLVIVLAMLALRVMGPVSPGLVAIPLLGLLGGAAALSLPPLRGGSPGAVDNATGVIAALRAGELLGDRADVGVLITGAEEFGMEGARAWVAAAERVGGFVNFDGIDANGMFNVMLHGSSSGGRASELHTTVCEVLAERGLPVRPRALPFGVFVDGSVLAGGGLWGITLSRGTWDTLGVVHTMRDAVERTDPRGAALAGDAAAEAIRRVLG